MIQLSVKYTTGIAYLILQRKCELNNIKQTDLPPLPCAKIK